MNNFKLLFLHRYLAYTFRFTGSRAAFLHRCQDGGDDGEMMTECGVDFLSLPTSTDYRQVIHRRQITLGGCTFSRHIHFQLVKVSREKDRAAWPIGPSVAHVIKEPSQCFRPRCLWHYSKVGLWAFIVCRWVLQFLSDVHAACSCLYESPANSKRFA